ncbi:MAG: cytochrome c biogenesis protein CcsA [Alphaproteobacteria bacterium]|nr:cytochrome c biogenesis protein CcsA [Alphaproteobacteria bacterium]
MSHSLLYGLTALLALFPASLLPLGRGDRAGGATFWVVLAVAVAGPTAWAVAQQADQWHTGVSAAIWSSIAVTTMLYWIVCVFDPAARRLAPLLLGYLALLGVLALLWQNEAARPLGAARASAWFAAHILVAIVAYGFLTLAAIAGAAVALRQRALKAKRSGGFVGGLPSIAEGEELQGRMLRLSALLLGAALISGMTVEWVQRRLLLPLDHKTVLSVLTFVLILGVLALRRRGGLSARRAAHYVLVAYLLLTLAYPGVKFVTDVLLRPAAS